MPQHLNNKPPAYCTCGQAPQCHQFSHLYLLVLQVEHLSALVDPALSPCHCHVAKCRQGGVLARRLETPSLMVFW